MVILTLVPWQNFNFGTFSFLYFEIGEGCRVERSMRHERNHQSSWILLLLLPRAGDCFR